MADYEMDSFNLTENDIKALGGDASMINTIKVWDPYPPAGWISVAMGPNYARVICPKPCGSITDPPPIQ